MSECGIEIRLLAPAGAPALQLLSTFQKTYPIRDSKLLKAELIAGFGEQFADIIYAPIATAEDVLKYRRFLGKRQLQNMDHFLFSLRNRTTNDERLWQDSYAGEVAAKEICPANIKLTTRSRTGSAYTDQIDLYYDSDENYALKAAVFATAFEAAGYHVEALSTSTEYEDDDC